MKNYLASVLAAAMVFIALLPAPSRAIDTETRLMVVSDLHYLSPSLYRDSDLFLRSVRKGDGKLPQYGEELLSALYREVLREKPDALIVTGDLTFNGEKPSHNALAAWFASVEAAGIPVWILPGNHDINISNALGFSGETIFGVGSVTPEEFAAIYADFLEPGNAGFSYVAKVSDKLWVAMTDVAWYQEEAQTFGVFTDRHEVWLKGVLEKAREVSARVVTATHHSLLQHTAFSRENYLMFGHERMAKLARDGGVRLNLSGHLHIQHIVREENLADAALGAFCIWPHRYALVTAGSDGSLSYESRALDEAFLPEGFSEMSREWFAGIVREKVAAALSGTEEEVRIMADYAARFNLAYFSGTFRKEDPSWTEDPASALWESQENTAFWQYMKLVMAEASEDSLCLNLPAEP